MDILQTPLYKFLSENSVYFEDAIRNLADGKIWFSGIESLNDPWESVAPIEDRIPRLLELLAENANFSEGAIHNIKASPEKIRQLLRNKGVYCCSSIAKGLDPLQNKLLWSHYANGGRGICVKYKPLSLRTLPSDKTGIFHGRNIIYGEKPNPIGKVFLDFLSFPDDTSKTAELVDLVLLQKPDCWEYEDEYRFISGTTGYIALENCPVSEIYFGPRAGGMVKCLVKEVFSSTDGVRCFDTFIDGYELKIKDHGKC